MHIYPETYYHLYNRSINKELLFKEEENYLYFLKQYRKRFEDKLDAIAYCLMPTHFHFLIYCHNEQENSIPQEIGIWLSSYTKAMNKRYNRSGSLFQRHTKAIPVDNDDYKAFSEELIQDIDQKYWV